MNKSVSVRFRKNNSIKTALERIHKIPGVVSSECLFPEEIEGALAEIYILEVEVSRVKEVVDKLLQDPEVDFAYETPPRTL